MLNIARMIFRVILGGIFIYALPVSILKAEIDQKKLTEKEQNQIRDEMISLFPVPKSSIEFELAFSFPSKDLERKEIYLWGPERIVSHNDDLFISDVERKQIIKFNSDGNYIKTIGRGGQGPGEFMNPNCIFLTNKHLVVSDTKNHTIQLFNQEGGYVKSFKVLKAYKEIAVNENEGLIFAAPIIMSKTSPLVDVFDMDGKENSISEKQIFLVQYSPEAKI